MLISEIQFYKSNTHIEGTSIKVKGYNNNLGFTIRGVFPWTFDFSNISKSKIMMNINRELHQLYLTLSSGSTITFNYPKIENT